MLVSLVIQNLATIDRAEILFLPGLNALTGETGAGKSILVGGLELALGDRASAEVIRAGENVAVAEATFDGKISKALENWLRDELGLEIERGEALVLRRELARSGRNRCLINGQMVGVGDLKRLGEALVDFHGQHEHQSLLRAAAPRGALDAFAGHDGTVGASGGLLENYEKAWEALSALRARARELDAAAADFERRLDYVSYQLEEIEKLNPQAGEALALEQEEKVLAHAEALARAAAEGFAILYDGVSEEQATLLKQLGDVVRRVAELAEVDAAFAPHAARLEDHKAGLEDLAWTLRDFAEKTQADPARLDEVIKRREALRGLMRKHGAVKGKTGNEEEAFFAAWEAMRAEREAMTRDDAERRAIAGKLVEAETAIQRAGEKLGASRRKAADKLKKIVEGLLHELAMEKARFEIAIEPLAAAGAGGLEEVDFLLAANPGLPPAPLRKVASGGELSRVMLALKSALAARDSIATLVFDEIDSGISGETSRRVGQQMEKLGASHQILCITHHAAIAARAARQFVVSKSAKKGETFTQVEVLEGDARLAALARMMGGEAAGDEARKLAKRLMA